jgi:hypothetical protein
MSTLHTRIASMTLALLLASTPSLAAAPSSRRRRGPRPRRWKTRPRLLESAIDQECRKVAREARAQCRKQRAQAVARRAQAVARLRAQAARKR